jgi:hypothetical protein
MALETVRGADPDDPVFLHTYGMNSLGPLYRGARLTAPASGTWVGSSGRLVLWPIVVNKPYPLARWYWLNGATVGTNFLQAAIYDEAFGLVAASPRTLSAGANVCQFVNPGLHGTNVRVLQLNNDQTSYNITSVVMKAGRLYLLSILNSHGTSASAVNSITGGGTWTSRATVQFNGTLNRQSIFSCVPAADFSGTITVDFAGVLQTGMVAAVDAIYHADTATNDGIVQNATGTGSSVTPLATLAAFGSANNGTYGAFGQAANAVFTPESTSYSELSDIGSTPPAQAQATYFRPDNDTTVSCTITSAAWGACAVEIKSLGTGPILIPQMKGWLAAWNDGATATVFRITSASSTPPHLVQAGPVVGGPPAVAVPTAAGMSANPGFYVVGFTRRATP